MRRIGAVTLAVALAVGLVSRAGPAVAAPGPPDAPEYWFDQWQVESLWSQGARGQGITIAEIDTGVNALLPELAGNVLPGRDFGVPGNGHIDRETSEFGHGTAMASIMVGQPGILGITGLAPGAKLLPIAVPLNGTTDAGKDDQIGPAIRWAADHGGKIISMSLGGGRSPSRDADPCPADEQQAVYYALQKGSVVVAASGNNGPTQNTVEDPGVCLGVVSVGAVDRNGTVASFSSRHPYLTLTAPGVNIASLSRVAGSAYSGDGTSQATAIASAVFALVWSKFPTLSARQVTARVLATLDNKRAQRDRSYGYGIIDAFRAVTARVPTSAPDPVYAAVAPFIARADAFATSATGTAPPPAATGNHASGRFAIESSPRLHTPRVRYGLATASAALVALLALAAGAWLARRRRARRVEAELSSARERMDEPELFWREITTPNAPDPPAEWWRTGPE